MFGEVARRGDQDSSARRQLPGRKPSILDRGMPDHRVVPAGGRVHPTIVEFERHLDPWIGCEEGIERRPEMQSPERHRG